MRKDLNLIGRNNPLLDQDIAEHGHSLRAAVSKSKFLVLGGAGSIGAAVVKEIVKRKPKAIDVVDINENGLAELVRDLRSSFSSIGSEFRTFAIDIGSPEFEAFFKHSLSYEYVLNLSALKHVRSEKDPYTLMRMIEVNIFNTNQTMLQAIERGVEKYFCVSTDKASNPVNMMGASKRIMEMYLLRNSNHINVSTARFANVAFSDGSLLHSFDRRIEKQQPLVAPLDVKRYFVTGQEAGELCLMSCILGWNRDIFFPKLDENIHLTRLSDILERYLNAIGYEPHYCKSEDEARFMAKDIGSEKKVWPCLLTSSDTTGEKFVEEFFTEHETLDLVRFSGLGVIKNDATCNGSLIDLFEKTISQLKKRGNWSKDEIVSLFHEVVPGFNHIEKGKSLDGKM